MEKRGPQGIPGIVFLILGVFLLLASPAMASEPDSLAFVYSGSSADGFWPGDCITLRTWWPEHAESLMCRLSNVDNGDTLSFLLRPSADDTLVAEGGVEFGLGWILSALPTEMDVFECSYGHRVVATAGDLADSSRLLVEPAEVSLSPDSLVVGSMVKVTWLDRDADRDYNEADSVLVELYSFKGGDTTSLVLMESGAHGGVFSATCELMCGLAQNADSAGLKILDADTIFVSGWDTLAYAPNWTAEVVGQTIDTHAAILTRSATVSILHPEYGDICVFPLDGDSIQCVVVEPDLQGVSEIILHVETNDEFGDLRDSTSLTLHEGDPGIFSGQIHIAENEGELAALPGDGLLAIYLDRANDAGIMQPMEARAELGAHMVQGEVTDESWNADLPYILVDSVFVPYGRSLSIDPGCVVLAIPDRSVAFSIHGHAVIGLQDDPESVRVSSNAANVQPGQWEGVLVTGSLVASHMVLSGARYGIRAEENSQILVESSRFFANGDSLGSSADPMQVARYSREGLEEFLRGGVRGWPGAITGSGAEVSIIGTDIGGNHGYGVSMTGGALDMSNSIISSNRYDGLLLVQGQSDIENTDFVLNRGGGIYIYDAGAEVRGCSFRRNSLEGYYSIGGTAELSESDLQENLRGGILLRDSAQCALTSVFIGRNHRFGIDEAWSCSLNAVNSAIVGNGGDGVVVDYWSSFEITHSNLGYNRGFAVRVGPWCSGDTLSAISCWWGEYPPPADSTGENLMAIWDGRDNPALSMVSFSPPLQEPPQAPAIGELRNVEIGLLSFEPSVGGIGDSLQLILADISPLQGEVFVAAEVFSASDTLVCILRRIEDSYAEFRGTVVLVNEIDPQSPDRIWSSGGEQLLARLVADTTITTTMMVDARDALPWLPQVYLTAFPNPFQHRLSLKWTAPGAAKIGIYDLGGRRVWHQTVSGGDSALTLDKQVIDSFASGVYVLVLRAGSYEKSVRIIRTTR